MLSEGSPHSHGEEDSLITCCKIAMFTYGFQTWVSVPGTGYLPTSYDQRAPEAPRQQRPRLLLFSGLPVIGWQDSQQLRAVAELTPCFGVMKKPSWDWLGNTSFLVRVVLRRLLRERRHGLMQCVTVLTCCQTRSAPWYNCATIALGETNHFLVGREASFTGVNVSML